MKKKSKQLSNPFSTGGGGHHFEAHVQAFFVALMLSGGVAPCLPCWPIVEVKLQGKFDGFDTDDLIVVVENSGNREKRQLLVQVKHFIAITKGSDLFGEVMQAAWKDFSNPKIFAKGKDRIALITGPLSAVDEHNVQWLLNQAKHKGSDDFFRSVVQANYSPARSIEKLQVFQYHLKTANGGIELSEDELYSFLKHFYLLSCDLGNDYGMFLSLIHSQISQFQQTSPQRIWARIVDVVQSCNQNAGTITLDNLQQDLLEAFKHKAVKRQPNEFKVSPEKPNIDWGQHPDATFLALTILIGAWNEKNKNDIQVLSDLLGISYNAWLQKARELLHCSDSPLSLKNGIWEIRNRTELWNRLSSRILDQDLETFQLLVVSVLSEHDPAFELPIKERNMASINGKVLTFSRELREGITEGLAILGSRPDACHNCSLGKVEATSAQITREIITDADWVLWGSLNRLLPTLAEASPREFLNAVEKALRLQPCPFDELFAQEGDGIFGENYLTGLLWALEGLAWDEKHLVHVCSLLAKLASHDPGGQWDNRPLNSLTIILLPWLPQTLAPFQKHMVTVQRLLSECPEVAWNLIINLLPDQFRISSGSHKPSWRMRISDDCKKAITRQEYWQQVTLYAELAIEVAGYDAERLSVLIDHFDNLPHPTFDTLLQVLSSQDILSLSEDQRLVLWDHFTKFARKHRCYSEAKWALSGDLISRIENVAEQLAPSDPFNLYQPLFSDHNFDLYGEEGSFEEQAKKFDEKRENALSEIYRKNGFSGVIRFAEAVAFPNQVGFALAFIADELIERSLFPKFLETTKDKLKDLVRGFIWKRSGDKGWNWCDTLDRLEWTPEQTVRFLAFLPFSNGAWDRASLWLGEKQGEYWSITGANSYETDENLAVAVEKLIEYGRPNAAIECFYKMLYFNQPIDIDQCIRTLLAAFSSDEPNRARKANSIIELIKYLQSETSVAQDDLFRIEWAYLPLLDYYSGAAPKLLERRLANDPEFFCEVIRLIYRSKNKVRPAEEPSEESKAIAMNASRLLLGWKTPPGSQDDELFNPDKFIEWIKQVKMICEESGHLEAALSHIGKVLIYAPADPDGLWIHRSISTVLDSHDAEEMRRGFSIGLYNSRGVHDVDQTGEPEKELSARYRQKAEETENAGFPRFADTLQDLADSYEKEAAAIISEFQQDLLK